jgi:uncharacterized protein
MQPIYFGPDRRVFGIYHPAQQRLAKASAIVLCQPFGHEYVRTHRAFRNLAQQLSRAGFPVLRFDYSGSGDSAGDGADRRLDHWIDDLSAAIDEVKRRSGVSLVSLAGLRFGAAVGAMTAARRRDIRAVVLWDPVVRGAEYLEQITQLHDGWLAARPADPAPAADDSLVVGFPLSNPARRDIAAVDLARLDPKGFPRLAVIVSDLRYVNAGWAQGVQMLYGPSAFSVVAPAADWENPAAIHTALLPQPILQAITTALVAAA